MVRQDFFTKFNLYFFNQSRGMKVYFSAVFHLVPIPNFMDVFHVRAVAAQHKEY